MKEQVTADTPMTVGMFNEYMALRAEASSLAVSRAMNELYKRVPKRLLWDEIAGQDDEGNLQFWRDIPVEDRPDGKKRF